MPPWASNPTISQAFIERWTSSDGSERANYQLFLLELCELLGLPKPDPASADNADNAYVFERRVTISKPDGSTSNGFIDLYRRGCFVLEAKQSGLDMEIGGWDCAMLRAHNQADQYVRALPSSEGRPPFIVVVDVGRNIELYAEFSRSGATYTAFPDARSYRISLQQLDQPEIQQRLRRVWLAPLSLDPSREAARVTRAIADKLAKLAKSLEAKGHSVQQVTDFMMRALFTMFAEDVGLLPKDGFLNLLQHLKHKPASFVPMVENLWQNMNSGGFSPVLESTLLRFNGGLFVSPQALPLDREQIEWLIQAATADWRNVEPAIFGTLLERALDPRERHKLGAHYTPRAYVERLVLPTVIEPLRKEWQDVQAAALAYQNQHKPKQAIVEVRKFHQHLCELRILDPACGSGNFLYITLEHLKRLEGEVLNLLYDLGETQGLLELQGVTVDPHQFLGLEINPCAARIAEMVIWIGYLQWHYRTHGKVNPPEPVLRDFRNIECRDAVISYDSQKLVRDERGKPLTRWDGITYITSPVTCELVPDESARVEQYRYMNPRKAEWPQADYIVGNPPFIGDKAMRRSLGEGYVDALRATWKEIPESADFVMYWWHIAAEAVRAGSTRQFGFISTNSIRQTFNRRVVQAQLEAVNNPLSLAFAIPDHPWLDAADGAAVRIAMTVGTVNAAHGTLVEVLAETTGSNDGSEVVLHPKSGKIFADLSTGANVAGAVALQANSKLTSNGVMLAGSGFIVTPNEAAALGLGRIPRLEVHIRHYRNGKDLLGIPRGVYVIDLFDLTPDDIHAQFPEVFQWVVERVKVERDHNNRAKLRERWWEFGEPRKTMRAFLTGLSHYVATVETSKHRLFVLLDGSILPDHMVIACGFSDCALHGVLSSRLHVLWALATGGDLGPTPRYNKTRCFDTFPFPDPTPEQAGHIRDLGERLDAHRKRQQELHPDLTLTGMYNVLEQLRRGEPLTAKHKTIHQQGLVSVLRELHDELDSAVFDAYGWNDLAERLVGLPGATTPLPDKPEAQAAAEEELLQRLVALNAERAAEEAQGKIRWLRPEYQNPDHGRSSDTGISTQTELATDTAAPVSTSIGKTAWPKTMREQISAVRSSLQSGPQTAAQIASQFRSNPESAVHAVLEALAELGHVASKDQ